MKAGKTAASICVAAIAFFAITASASADTVQVTNSGDSAGCTLRNALVAINAHLGGGTGCIDVMASGDDQITFAPSVTSIALSTLELPLSDINGPLDVVGPGMGSLTITAPASARVFNELSGNTVTVSGMTIRGGANGPPAVSDTAEGGCILNAGTETLTGVRVTGCTVTAATGTTGAQTAIGGGISNNGTLTLDNSIVDGNHATATNSANDTTGAGAEGAGISSQGFGLTMTNSTISGNQATASDTTGTGGTEAYGGLRLQDSPIISHSTISGNTATASESNGTAFTAGAMTMTGGSGPIDLSTIANHIGDASGDSNSVSIGGIYMQGATLALHSTTIAFNGPTSGSFDGTNVYQDDGGTTMLSNSILADPRGGGLNCVDPSGTVTSAGGGFNLDYSPGGVSSACGFGANVLHGNPQLGSLASNGGPTQTIALQPTSPAIDAGKTAPAVVDQTHDQRGLTRPYDFSAIPNAAGGDASDIGSFELQPACLEQIASPTVTCPSAGGGGGNTPPPTTTPPTGQRAAALAKCKKKHGRKRKKCVKHANKLPV